MSDSDLSDVPSAAVPPDSTLEKSLRGELRKAAKVSDDYTVKTVREASEKSLGLDVGFYKTHDIWSSRSKEIIKDEVEKLEATEDPPVASTSKSKLTKKTEPKRPAKRKSPDQPPQSRKKAKKAKSVSESEELSSTHSDSEEQVQSEEEDRKKTKNSKPQPPSRKQQQDQPPSLKQDNSDADSDARSDDPAPNEKGDGSESEMSVLLDDEPPKQRKNKKDAPSTKSSAGKSKSSTPKSAEDADPDKEEIKKLQGWLVKCGVRKVWGKELKPYETSKAKIKHLKEMLSDVGMTGRFSNEKAASIREARELAADIEAVQEGAERWGKSDDGSGDDAKGDGDRTRSGRRVVRGATNYDFLSSDGEETD